MKEDLRKTFSEDLDNLVSEMIDDYGLKYEEEEKGLADPLLRWLDFTFRYIPPAKRKIHYSTKFPKKLDPAADAAFRHIESLITSGADLNPYQSKGLILHNDTSGQKRQTRTDLLFADWGIHHLHLTTSPLVSGRFFSDRSEWLLFGIFGPDQVGLVDIRNHNDKDVFSDPDLFSTIVESWPNLVESYRVQGFDSISNLPATATETAAFRKSGITSFVSAKGSVYLGPGMGVTAASTSTRTAMAMTRIHKYVRQLADLCSSDEFVLTKKAAEAGVADPDFHLVLFKEGLGIHELKSNEACLLPRSSVVGNMNGLAELHDLVLPEWSLPFLLSKSGA